MAIYHLSVQIIKRSEGRSAIAAAAYRSGTSLTSEWDGIIYDYTRKGWVEHTEIPSAGVRTRNFQEASAPMESGRDGREIRERTVGTRD